jgi:hypothetical protein
MNASLTATQLLHIWEQGQTRHPHQAVKVLLQSLLPPEANESVDTWTIGQRDRFLFKVRDWLFGQVMECGASCPNCDQRIEFSLSTLDLRQPDRDTSEPLALEVEGYRVYYQLPTLADLDTVADLDSRRSALLKHCIVKATLNGEGIDAETLPPALLDEVAAQMGKADAQAYIRLELACPDCGAQWHAPFDIASYLWQELGTWAKRVQREVHLIATAYGWTETEILGLPSFRRQAYINLILGK